MNIELARAQVGTARYATRLLKLGAVIVRNIRRVLLYLASVRIDLAECPAMLRDLKDASAIRKSAQDLNNSPPHYAPHVQFMTNALVAVVA